MIDPIKEIKEKQAEFRKQTAGYMTAAFGLIVGLAWNDAVKTMIEYFFPLDKNSILIKFGYAIILTLLVVLIIQVINKFVTPKE